MFEDEPFLRFARRASGLVVLGGVLAAALWGAAMSALHAVAGAPVVPFELGAMFGEWGNRLLGVEGGQGFTVWWWVLLVAVSAASFALHELVHAFFFKQYAPPGTRVTFGSNLGMGMLYANAEGVVYGRAQYLTIALAPSVVVTLLLMAVGLGLRWPLWTILVVVVHLSGCTGDWGYVRAIVRNPAIAFCEDTSYGVAFYAEGRADADRGPGAHLDLVDGGATVAPLGPTGDCRSAGHVGCSIDCCGPQSAIERGCALGLDPAGAAGTVDVAVIDPADSVCAATDVASAAGAADVDATADVIAAIAGATAAAADADPSASCGAHGFTVVEGGRRP